MVHLIPGIFQQLPFLLPHYKNTKIPTPPKPEIPSHALLVCSIKLPHGTFTQSLPMENKIILLFLRIPFDYIKAALSVRQQSSTLTSMNPSIIVSFLI